MAELETHRQISDDGSYDLLSTVAAEDERAISEPQLVVDVDGFEGPLDLLLGMARTQ